MNKPQTAKLIIAELQKRHNRLYDTLEKIKKIIEKELKR
jgi:hypothetical protein